MCTLNGWGKHILAGGAALAMLASLDTAYAGSFSVLYTFGGGSGDGAYPEAGLFKDAAGNLYGTTYGGGSTGEGTVFELAPDGTEKVLHFFGSRRDGAYPVASLIEDSAGNLYGTTVQGGSSDFGTVFELAPDGTETVLHAFAGGSDGANPGAGLIMDSAGNLYGTTEQGGSSDDGTVFELAPDGTETVLHSFAGGSDGDFPEAGLIEDSAGNLYGTTDQGGSSDFGTVFELAPDGTETVLHSFGRRSDGASPVAGLIMDSAGILYGTTEWGGTFGYGTVFKLAPDGTEKVLYAFGAYGVDGAYPEAGLVKDAAGNLYGTTYGGGSTYLRSCPQGCGTVFELVSGYAETILHDFSRKGKFGKNPVAGLIEDSAGNLYGTTEKTYTDLGTVFEIEH